MSDPSFAAAASLGISIAAPEIVTAVIAAAGTSPADSAAAAAASATDFAAAAAGIDADCVADFESSDA